MVSFPHWKWGNGLADVDLPENVKAFVLSYIDSVELLEIILILKASGGKHWDAKRLSRETRGSENSIQARLSHLNRLGFIEEDPANSHCYIYAPKKLEWAATIDELAALYPTKKHRILALVFTPLKNQARVIADAFRISPHDPDEDNDG